MTRSAYWWIVAMVVVGARQADAGPERIAWPEGYGSAFVRYHSVDKPKKKFADRVRFFYVNVSALAAAKAGQPLPEGTVLVMEDHLAALGADGEPVRTSDGRFVAGTEITNIFVQEKRSGWGQAYPQGTRNGDWDYAWFLPDGSRKSDAKFDGCFSCHKKQAAADFNFTFTRFVDAIKR